MIDIDEVMSKLDIHQDRELLDQWIETYTPFIISTLSHIKNEYIVVENDESFSIALMAFVEAVERYDVSKGPFLPFCKLVITSRVNTFLKQENRHHHLSIDGLETTPKELVMEEDLTDRMALAEEIATLEDALSAFGISFAALTDSAPKHEDTKNKVIEIAQRLQADPLMLQLLYTKKRLPITQIALRYMASIKTLKAYKSFIIAIVLIMDKDLSGIKDWLDLHEKVPKI